ncbi:hypothetical protein Dimus_001928 [Dionaea muscipula]
MEMEAHRLPILAILLLLFSITSPPSSLCGATCNRHDKEVLLKIKAELGNPYALTSWSADTDCCVDWYAVTCNADNRTNQILVQYDSNLKSTIPSIISELPYLELIFFHKLPGLVGTIPESITKLKLLTQLWITWTNVTGFPDFITKIPTLTYINLSFNNLTGTIPAALAGLPSVNYVDLSRNKLTGPIPASFGSFKQASNFYLILSNNQLSGSIPASLTKLTLQNFNVSFNKLSGQIPQGGSLQSYDQYAYLHNKGLCGSPLPACK